MSDQERDNYDERAHSREVVYPISITAAGTICLIMGLLIAIVSVVLAIFSIVDDLFEPSVITMLVFAVPLGLWQAKIGYDFLRGRVKDANFVVVVSALFGGLFGLLAVGMLPQALFGDWQQQNNHESLLVVLGVVAVSVLFISVSVLVRKGHAGYLLWRENQDTQEINRISP